MPTELTSQELKEVFNYNPETGILTWKKLRIRNQVRLGDEVGSLHHNGYLTTRFDGKFYLNHRIVYAMHHNKWPKELDHIDQNRTNNRIANLREVTRQENMRNQKLYKKNKSGAVGVCWNKLELKWKARIGVNGKRVCLGTFANLQDAVEAREEGSIKYLFHQNHGKPHA